MIVRLIHSQINNIGLVDDCWRWWEVGPVLSKVPLLLSSPVTQPNVRGREESVAEEVHGDTEEESKDPASAGEISVVEIPSH